MSTKVFSKQFVLVDCLHRFHRVETDDLTGYGNSFVGNSRRRVPPRSCSCRGGASIRTSADVKRWEAAFLTLKSRSDRRRLAADTDNNAAAGIGRLEFDGVFGQLNRIEFELTVLDPKR